MLLIDVKKGKYKKNGRMTKKEFINALFEFDKQPTRVRKPYKIQSNAIQFDSDSWLYFNDISKCYRHNNILITIKERYDNWDECFKNDIMAYWVGDTIG